MCQPSLFLKGYLDFSHWPTSRGREERPVSTPIGDLSPFDDIISYWKHACHADIEAAIKKPTHSSLFAMKIVASSWLVLLTFLSHSVGILESAVHRFEDLDPRPRASTVTEEIARLRKQMANVNRLRRYLWWYIYHMKSNLEAVGQATAGPVLNDFLVINERLLLIQKNVDSLMPIVMGANSLLETQLNSLDTKYVLRLTILALFFVPISSTAGFFSMAEKYLPGQPDSWVVALVCVLLLLAVFSLAFWGVVVEKLRLWGERRGFARGSSEYA
jgi:Mg2+ and Co2+ transporter CorA